MSSSDSPTRHSLDALRHANPRSDPSFTAAVDQSETMKQLIMATDPAEMTHEQDRCDERAAVRPAARRAHPRRRLVGFSAAGAMLAVGAIVATLLTVGGSPGAGGPTVENAYAAVSKAVADTSALATSGTITTRMVMGTEADMRSTFSWNGENAQLLIPADKPTSIQLPTGDQLIRVVDGRYYESTGKGVWRHYAAFDIDANTDPRLTPNPAGWVAAAHSDLSGGVLRKLTTMISGLQQTAAADGSVTYSGSATATLITHSNLGVNGLSFISRPLMKVPDPNAPVAVSVTVGPDGIISSIHMTYDSPIGPCEYTATYSKIGSTPPIVAPDPSNVTEAEPPLG